MTNKEICKWLLDTEISDDNEVQWEALANSVWLQLIMNPINTMKIMDISNIMDKAKAYGKFEIPNEKTVVMAKICKMIHDENADIIELQKVLDKL